MSPEERDYLVFIEDILDAAHKAMLFIDTLTYDQFVADEKTTFACIRALEIIGEAGKKIPKEFQRKHPNIRWKEMSGMRDVLIHNYMNVDLSIVWRTIKTELPHLIESLHPIVHTEP